MTDASRIPYGPKVPSDWTTYPASVDEALDELASSGGGSGDVSGPGSSTDNAVARFDGTGGKTIQDSGVTIDDSDNVSGVGNITLSGTVDGRDVASDGSKLDGIEAGADVTDAANVEAAGAIMDSDFAGDGLLVRTSAGNYVHRSLSAGDAITITTADGVSANPQIAVDAAASIDASKGSLQLDGDAVSPGNDQYYGTDGSGTKGFHAVPKPYITVTYGNTSATSGTQAQRGAVSNTGVGVDGWYQTVAPFDMRLVYMTLFTEVSSYTAGQMEVEVNLAPAGGGSNQAIVSEITSSMSGTGNYREEWDFTAQTYDWDVGDSAAVVLKPGNGSMTIRDSLVLLVFEEK